MSAGSGRTRAAAVITVHKYEPSAYDESAEGPVLTRIHVEESFSCDIAGDGVVEFLLHRYRGVSRAASSLTDARHS